MVVFHCIKGLIYVGKYKAGFPNFLYSRSLVLNLTGLDIETHHSHLEFPFKNSGYIFHRKNLKKLSNDTKTVGKYKNNHFQKITAPICPIIFCGHFAGSWETCCFCMNTPEQNHIQYIKKSKKLSFLILLTKQRVMQDINFYSVQRRIHKSRKDNQFLLL